MNWLRLDVGHFGLAGATGLGLWAALLCASQAAGAPQAKTFYVATNGNDAWSGTLAEPNSQKTDGPFATLERARDEIRQLKRQGGLPGGGVNVELRGGLYERQKPFELGPEDSGTPESPVVYQARRGEEVRLSGGKRIGTFRPVTDPDVLARLDQTARGKVLQSDLRAQGIKDFGEVKGGGLQLFFLDRPMTLARWPNQGFVKIVDLVGGQPFDVRGTKGDKIGKFMYDGDRPKRWTSENDPWVHGYWFRDWADQRHKVESIDTERRIIAVVPPYHRYGYRKGQWFYAFNLLAELDAPGEWYLDRQAGTLYFWPPSPIEQGRATVSLIDNLVTLREASYITFRGITFEAARGTAVTITGGADNCIAGCTLRNLGSWAVRISGGTAHSVLGCDIYQTGDGGLSLSGGERKSLTPGRHVAENNHIHHYSYWNRMYQPGVSINGVGLRVAHNLIHDAPHCAIIFGGNDHLMEFNEIHHVCTEANDAGAIYSGHDWTQRGTVIRYNFLHHISGREDRGCVGVYLDDMFCGTQVFGNVFYRVTMAAFIGGGRDNTIENNLFVDCRPAVHVDARAMGWAKHAVAGVMKQLLDAMPYQSPLWKARYPKLPSVWEDEPAAPKGNLIVRNVSLGGRWDHIEKKAQPYLTMQDNLVTEEIHYVDTNRLNFQLPDDSPIYRQLPGFKRIPFAQIGLKRDQYRDRLPQPNRRPQPE